MKKLYLIFIIVIFALLIMSGCQEQILTYDNPGTITITITNSDILARDVTVSTSDVNAEYDREGKTITITQDKMLRIMITLSVDGYISKNIVVKSTDYNLEYEYAITVTFEESYISMELTVITDAPTEDIDFLNDDIISYKNKGNVYDIKLGLNADPEVTVSVGEGYKDYTVTLTALEISKRICSRTIMLLDDDYVLVELFFDSIYNINLWSMSEMKVTSYQSGNNYSYAIPKDADLNINVYKNFFEYYGEITLTPAEMSLSDYFYYTESNINRNINYTVTPYLNNSVGVNKWCVFAEKDGDDYIPVEGRSHWGDIQGNLLFKSGKEYYVFTSGGDGKVRYKELDIEDAEFNTSYGQLQLNVVFDNDDPVRNIELVVIDFTDDLEDFSGISATSSSSENLGTVVTGNTIAINPSSYYTYINLDNLPLGYFSVNNDMNNEDFLYKMALLGKYEIYIAHSFDLYVHIDSTTSYQDELINNNNNYNVNYTIDNNNTALITEYNYNDNYSMFINNNYYDLRALIGAITNITIDNLGDYHVTITLH